MVVEILNKLENMIRTNNFTKISEISNDLNKCAIEFEARTRILDTVPYKTHYFRFLDRSQVTDYAANHIWKSIGFSLQYENKIDCEIVCDDSENLGKSAAGFPGTFNKDCLVEIVE